VINEREENIETAPQRPLHIVTKSAGEKFLASEKRRKFWLYILRDCRLMFVGSLAHMFAGLYSSACVVFRLPVMKLNE
jgi:hypothetical protein